MNKELQKQLEIMNLQSIIVSQRLAMIQILLIAQNNTDSDTLDTIEEMENEIRHIGAKIKSVQERDYAI